MGPQEHLRKQRNLQVCLGGFCGVQISPSPSGEAKKSFNIFQKEACVWAFRLKNTIPQTSQHTQTQKTSIHLKRLKVPLAPTLRSPLRIMVSPVIKTAHLIFKIKIKLYISFKGGGGLSLSSHRGSGGEGTELTVKQNFTRPKGKSRKVTVHEVEWNGSDLDFQSDFSRPGKQVNRKCNCSHLVSKTVEIPGGIKNTELKMTQTGGVVE